MPRTVVARRTAAVASVAALLVPLALLGHAPAAAAPTAAPGASHADAPNILLIKTDDQVMDSLPRMAQYMPQLSAHMSANGREYTNSYVSSPSCCQSRASTIVGRYPHNEGVWSQSAGGSLDARGGIASYLQRAGYSTSLVGKYLNLVYRDLPGFDDWTTVRGACGGTETEDCSGLDAESWYYNFKVTSNSLADPAPEYVVRDGTYNTTWSGARLREYVGAAEAQRQADGTPWYAEWNPTAPHTHGITANMPEPAYRTLPVPGCTYTPEADRTDKPAYVRAFGPAQSTNAWKVICPAAQRTLRSVDDEFGRIIAQLTETGALADTMIVFTSDNGLMNGEHDLVRKFVPYEPSIRVPLLVSWPGRVPVGQDHRLAANIDILPTVLQAAGVPVDPALPPIDGQSLLRPATRTAQLSEYRVDPGWASNVPAPIPTWAAFTDSRMKYIETYTNKSGTSAALGFTEYYDLVDDPGEMTNLLADGDPANDPDVAALRARLATLRACSGTSVTADPRACSVTPPPTPTQRTIAQIQGTGAASPFVGDRVRTSGVVTAVYPSGGFSGFYLQTGGTGGNGARTASDGIFVSTTAGTYPAMGDSLSVTGEVTEFFGLTQLRVTEAADVTALPQALPPVTPVTTAWPRTDTDREVLEGMSYRPTGEYTITNTTADTFGEVGLAFGSSPLLQPTEVELPGSPAAAAVEADNAARKVTLDDGASTSFSATNAITPSYVSNDEPVVVGGKASFTDPVIVDFRFNLWKFQPTTQVVGPVNAASPADFTSPRTAAPNASFLGDGQVRVASFNVLNYFTTLGSETAGCQPFNDSDGNGNTVRSGCDLRGAWDAQDLARQQSKIVKAINGTTADVVGLMELENSAKVDGVVDEALDTLVDALNADAGSEVWAANPSSAELPDLALRDVITNGIIFKKNMVTRVGAARALGSESGSGGAFDNAREPIGQVFTPKAGGSPFLFVVNHFKSKGSAGPLPGDADAGDGQGASNASRVAQAAALRDWIPTALTATGTKAVITVGDYNAYSQEDPIRLLNDAGYVDAEAAFPHGEYSYSFAGLSGSLDHVLLNQAALGRATGADIWNINSGESLALEYSRFNYSETDFHRGDPFRSSDHDPVVVGLRAAATPVPVQILATNDFHGRLQANGAEAGAAVLAGAVKQLRAAQPNTVFAAAGDLIGASTFESFIAQDKPTIDALNEAGLEVSAVGNHEFDQGYDDLVNRVLAPYDAQTNPFGGAAWEYLGANVRNADDNTPALPETFTRTFQGIKVGFVGVVTEDLPELVSPDGIAGLEVTDIVQAANRNADTLRAGGADIVVLLVHEGAPTDKLADAVNPNNAFGKIVTGVNDTIDAIVSGHTHLAYNHQVPVPGWADRPVTTRPVVSAGQYGTNLDQLLFQVDPDTEKVIGLTSNLLPLVKNPAYPTDPATKTIVDQAVAPTTVTSSGSPSVYGQPVTFTASVGGTATGSVQFMVDGRPLGGPVTLVDGAADSPAVQPDVGARTVTAAFRAGDMVSSGSVTQVVQPASSTTTVAGSPARSAFGAPVAFTATVTGPTSGGTVQFTVDGSPYGNPVPLVSGTATSATTSLLSVATHAVRASFSGDAGTTGSTGVTTHVVGRATSTTTVTSSGTPSVLGAPVRFTATVSAPAVRGAVQFVVDGTPVGAPVALSGRTATSPPISTMSVGAHTVSARYGGDVGATPSAGTVAQQVQYLVKVLAPTGGGTASRTAPLIVRLQLTDVSGVAVPDAEAAAPAPGTCRVKVRLSGAQTVAATCVPYLAATDEFRHETISNGKPGLVTATVTVHHPGAATQVVAVRVTRR